MPLTPNQEQAVKCTGRPLFIQAGAGTGKTFTLTKRLAYQLSEENGPLLQSVDNVLIITFTEKAAEELLGRVRAELRAQGMAQAALQIDGAWISTIHGMCSSMLGAHALEAGIDPGMPMLSQEDGDALLALAVNEQLQTAPMRQLTQDFGVQASCELVAQLASLLALTPQGAQAFAQSPASGDATVALRALDQRLGSALGGLEAAGVREAASETRLKCLANLTAAQDAVSQAALQGDCDWDTLARLIEGLKLPKGGNTGKAFKGYFEEAVDALVEAYSQAIAARAQAHLELALDVSQHVAERFAAMKAQLGVQDTDDLLMGAYRLLEKNPIVAQAYEQRFGSVMVDEFQDTDLLQVGIVEYLCDERLSTLTTVGDAQQSIYGFRGADLETYRNMREKMSALNSQEVELNTNYRSHPDILAFVESVFSKREFFGDDFLRIDAGPANARAHSWTPEGEPRVKLLLTAGSKNPDGRQYTGIGDLREAEAKAIAAEFAEYARNGAEYGQMALLMSSTKAAGPYLAAMRELGIPCAVSGGSDFYTQPEIEHLTALLRVLELPDDDQALLTVLAGPIFDVCDGDLLSLRIVAKRELRNPGQDDMRPKVTLWDALTCQARRLPQDENDLLQRAYALLRRAVDAVGKHSLANVFERLLDDCGWLDELRTGGAAGLAVAANVQRFCDLLAEFERQNGPSAVKAAEHFKNMLEMAKDGSVRGKPGRMVGLGNDAVQVMTIHASKGLEFPIVAVAQYARGGRAATGPQLLALTQDGERHLVLTASVDGVSKGDYKKCLAEHAYDVDSFAAAHSATEYNLYAQRLEKERAAQEEQRLLYVALTRARDVLLLCSCDSAFADKGEVGKGLFADVANALFPEGMPQQSGRYKLDTGCIAELKINVVPYVDHAAIDASEEERDGALSDTAVPHKRTHRTFAMKEQPSVRHTAPKSERAIASYSALASRKGQDGDSMDDEGSPASTARAVLAKANQECEDEQPLSASPFGSAFHAFAQWLALQVEPTEIDLAAAPAQVRMRALSETWGLGQEESLRFLRAAHQWQESNRFAQTRSFKRIMPEYPFCVQIAGTPVEGFIDLLCLGGVDNAALVIDYKTGASGEANQLEKRYKLQGAVYAYAVLDNGLAPAVDVVFVRPEVDMQEVTYRYEKKDLDELRQLIEQAGN